LISEKSGKVIKGLGGLYTTRVEEEGEIKILTCRAKGALHRDEEKVLVGDNVKITVDNDTPDGIVISEIMPRKNSLIRPPMANIDYLFIVFASKKPTPVLEVVDKLIAIAIHNKIIPVAVISKSDLGKGVAEEYYEIYKKAGVESFITTAAEGEGVEELRRYITEKVREGKTAAFAGASGVGKSTLMNSLFPTLNLPTSDISRKIERGKHTTRHVEIFDIEASDFKNGFLADTPGFSLVDFARFDFFSLEELGATFPDISAHAHGCRYQDCAHVGEGIEECAVARAESVGLISPSRLESYRAIYRVLKEKSKNEYK
jgi:ribosome biogenesis GTPase